ncbi:MAG: DUF892 family protein [Phycisphaerae bacterium]|nr:DUF892 family protein [Phycisphaerae bacterium]
MKVQSLEDALIEELRDLLSAEQQLTKALPRLSKQCEWAELRAALEFHLEETRGQAHRVKACMEALGVRVRAKKCEAMAGLIAERDELAEVDAPPAIKDVLLCAAAQKIEHYEMASYECAIGWAGQVGNSEILRALRANLKQEQVASDNLRRLAQILNTMVADEVERMALMADG